MTTQSVTTRPRAPYQLGIDVGSTTVKAVVLDGNRRSSDYRRHNADVRIARPSSLTSSASAWRPRPRGHHRLRRPDDRPGHGEPFVQEVIAGTRPPSASTLASTSSSSWAA